MTFAIVSNWHSAEFEELAQATIPNRIQFAAAHDYAVRMFKFPGHFGKLSAILESWNVADWLWWLDVDAIVTNPRSRLEELTAGGDVVISCDQYGLNSGSMLFRTIPEVRRVLEEIVIRHRVYDVAPWHDQNGLAYQLWTIRDRVRIVEKRRMNSYPDDWQPGDFVLHCPGMPNVERLALLMRYLEITK